MHGKECICRAFLFWRTAKSKRKFAPLPLVLTVLPRWQQGDGRLGKKFVMRYAKTHGKLKGLPCIPKKTHGKLFFPVRFLFAMRPI
jgi:hypothetical protein